MADNGSTDGSRELAERAGARVVLVDARGYGAALAGGFAAARGRYVVMGDADLSYDFGAVPDFVKALEAGADLVMGSRFRGEIEKGRDAAAPPMARKPGSHRTRPALLPRRRVRLPLRPARLPPRRAPGPRPEDDRDGVRERDGRQGGAVRADDPRDPRDAPQGRPVAAAAPQDVARRLASPAFPSPLLASLALPRARPRARPRRRRPHRVAAARPARARPGYARRSHDARRSRDGPRRRGRDLLRGVREDLRDHGRPLAEGPVSRPPLRPLGHAGDRPSRRGGDACSGAAFSWAASWASGPPPASTACRTRRRCAG